MRVMKFGGTSVGSAARMREVCRLAERALLETRVVLVASAASGVTNLLVDATQKAAAGDEVEPFVAAYAQRHTEIVERIAHPNR